MPRDDAVDLVEVWNTLRRDIPQLIAYVEPLAPQKPDSEHQP